MKLLEGATNLGGPLEQRTKDKVLRYLRDPTPDAWIAARSVIIQKSPLTTIWQAVAKLDPRFRDENAYPDVFLVGRAVRKVLDSTPQK